MIYFFDSHLETTHQIFSPFFYSPIVPLSCIFIAIFFSPALLKHIEGHKIFCLKFFFIFHFFSFLLSLRFLSYFFSSLIFHWHIFIPPPPSPPKSWQSSPPPPVSRTYWLNLSSFDQIISSNKQNSPESIEISLSLHNWYLMHNIGRMSGFKPATAVPAAWYCATSATPLIILGGCVGIWRGGWRGHGGFCPQGLPRSQQEGPCQQVIKITEHALTKLYSWYLPVFRSLYFLAGAGVMVRLHLTVDKTDEVLNAILFVSSHIDKRLFKKRILKNKWHFSSKEGVVKKKKFNGWEPSFLWELELRLRNTGYCTIFSRMPGFEP